MDADLAMRIRRSGRALIVAPGARSRHRRGASSTRPFKRFIAVRNAELFRERWGEVLAAGQEPRGDAGAAAIERALARAAERRAAAAAGPPPRSAPAEPVPAPDPLALARRHLELHRAYEAELEPALEHFETEANELRARVAELDALLRERERQLAEITGGGWWRLRERLLPLLGVARRAAAPGARRVNPRLHAALNGDRDHPALPRTPGELAVEARAAVDAGAAVVHLHPYDADGRETFAAEPCARALHAVREACPGTPVSLSTSAAIESDPERRAALVAAWTELPDLVTANQGEDGIVALCEQLLERGVGIEAGLLELADARAFAGRPELAARCTRVMLEPLDADPDDAVAHAAAMEELIAEAGISTRAGPPRRRHRVLGGQPARGRPRSRHPHRARGHAGAARRARGGGQRRAGGGRRCTARRSAMSAPRHEEASFADGVRAGIPFGVAGGLLALSFGVVAKDAGLSAVAAIVMSAIVFAGSAQFASVAILAQGGGVGAAVAAAALMNSRFLPMGVALAPSLPGGAASRAAQGQPVVDASWALAAREDGSFDRMLLFGSSLSQYVAWVTGTAVGAIWGDALGDPKALGLDAVYPAFFVALLLVELRNRRALGAAALGSLIALALVPVAPAGVPVLVASLAALIGLIRRPPASPRAEAAAR